MSRMFISALLIICAASPVWMIGIGVVKLGAIVPTPTERGVPSTVPPGNDIKLAPTYYKDYYQKTRVIVTHPVSTVLYFPDEYSTTDIEIHELHTDYFLSVYNASTIKLEASMIETIAPTRSFDEFDWPTEIQMFTKVINASATVNVTQTVENSIPFV